MNISGTWTLNVSDRSPNDAGWLNHWCLQASVSEVMPVPTPTPTSVYLPPSAYVSGMSGDDQQLNLDCEVPFCSRLGEAFWIEYWRDRFSKPSTQFR